jgi:glycosyltransferase involved in cell wall biosynthesis
MSSSTRRLLVLTTTLPSVEGDATPSFVLDLAQEMADQLPADITIVAPAAQGAPLLQRFGSVTVRRFRYLPRRWASLGASAIVPALRRNPLRLLEVPFLLAGLTAAAIRSGRRTRPHIIHAHWVIPVGTIAVVVAALLRQRPLVVVSSHGADVFALPGRVLRRARRWVTRRADLVIPASRVLAHELDCDPDSAVPMGASRLFGTALPGRSPDAPFLFVGRLDTKKGVDVLLRAAANVAGLQLRIVGDGPLRGELEALSHALGIADRTCFAGAMDKAGVAEEMSRAGALVIPSVIAADGDREAGPVVALEAVLSHLPVICTRLGEVPNSLLVDGKSAFIVEPGDLDGLSSALAAAWSSPDLRKAVAAEAHTDLSGRASMSYTAARYAQMIFNALPGDATPVFGERDALRS